MAHPKAHLHPRTTKRGKQVYVVEWRERTNPGEPQPRYRRQKRTFTDESLAQRFRSEIDKQLSARREMWIDKRAGQHQQWKGVLARYTRETLVDHGQTIQIASGTQCHLVMKEIMQARITDLNVLTTNLRVLDEALRAKRAFPDVFGSMHVIVTGGEVLPELDSLVGDSAAEHVKTSELDPDVVVMSAKSVAFHGKNVLLRLHYTAQRTVHHAYATRRTVTRAIVYDHSKLAVLSGWGETIPVKDLVEACERCIFITSFPGESTEQQRRHQAQFEDFCTAAGDLAQKIELHFVDKDGNRVALR